MRNLAKIFPVITKADNSRDYFWIAYNSIPKLNLYIEGETSAINFTKGLSNNEWLPHLTFFLFAIHLLSERLSTLTDHTKLNKSLNVFQDCQNNSKSLLYNERSWISRFATCWLIRRDWTSLQSTSPVGKIHHSFSSLHPGMWIYQPLIGNENCNEMQFRKASSHVNIPWLWVSFARRQRKIVCTSTKKCNHLEKVSKQLWWNHMLL